MVTIGGWGSTHCLAAVRHARALGASAVVAQVPQGSSASGTVTHEATAAEASACYRARGWAGFPLAWLRARAHARRLGRARYIPGGGATPAAALGHALALLELNRQLETPPDAILTPLGSGGTAAGLLLGCALLEWPTRVVAVRVAPRVVANRWRVESLVRGAQRLLRRRSLPHPHIPTRPLLVVSGIGRGYGYPSAAGERAREWGAEAGLDVDSTYGGKTLAALPELARMGFTRVVYWHTYAAPGRTQ